MEVELKKCERCSFKGVPADFIGISGKVTKKCKRCLVFYYARRERLITKRQTIVDTTPGTKMCASCLYPCKLSGYNTLPDGSLTKVCTDCCKRSVVRITNAQKLESNKVIRRLTRKQYRQKMKSNEEWKQRQRVVEKRARDKNPKRLKYRIYRRGARIRGLAFLLTYREVCVLFHTMCYYCGFLAEGKLNGIDRFQNNLSYSRKNCRACCKKCNIMKSEWEYESWIMYIGHILAHNNRGGVLNYDKLFNTKRGTYSVYQNSAKDRNYVFEITPEEFTQITSGDCHICGKKNSKVHLNGIDRVVNEIGYVIQNCRPCCYSCNALKRNYSIEDMLSHCERIYAIHGPNVAAQESPFKKNKRAR